MASFVKFQPFVENLAEKVFNLGSDQLVAFLTNTLPNATDNDILDITEISYTYCSSRNITTASSAQTSGTYKLTLTDLVLTASGGSVGAFRYAGIYDDDAAGDELICYWDYGSSITLNDGETFTYDFDGTNGVLTIA